MAHRKVLKCTPASPTNDIDYRQTRHRLDDLLNEGLVETFPASDPVAVLQPVTEKPKPAKAMAGRRRRTGRSR